MIIGSDGYDNWEYGSSISLSVMFVLRMAFVNSAGHFRTFEDYIVTITNAEPMMWKQGMEMVTIVTWSIFSAVGGVCQSHYQKGGMAPEAVVEDTDLFYV